MSATSQKPSVVIGLPVLLVGGTERQTLTMMEILCGVEYSVTVLCYYEYDERVEQLFSLARFRKAMALVYEQN